MSRPHSIHSGLFRLLGRGRQFVVTRDRDQSGEFVVTRDRDQSGEFVVTLDH